MSDSPSAAVLIGRDNESTALAAALDAARTGRGGVVLLGGEAGIGKTQLAGHAAALATQRGMRTVWGRCSTDPGAPAYWPWVQALRTALRSVASHTISDRLGPHLEMLVYLLPELQEHVTPPPIEQGADPGQARFRLFESATALMLCIASLPPERDAQSAGPGAGLVIVLDDIDQADDASLALLVFVAQAIVDAPILIIGTFRQETPAERSSVSDSLAELARVRGTLRLLLPPLDTGAVQSLLTHMLGTPVSAALAASVYERAGGVPFYVTELARALQGHPPDLALTMVPPNVREIVHARVAWMATATVMTITTASVLGQEFDIGVLAAMTDQPLDPTLDAIAEAERVHLVTAAERPGAYRFAHAIVRDTLYEALPTAQRVRLHRLAGEAMERRYGPSADAHCAALAHHYFQALPAGTAGPALQYAERAGRQAEAVYAHAEAARFYEMGLVALGETAGDDLERRFDLLLAAGRSHERAGANAQGTERLLEAATCARRLDTPERLLETALAFEHRISYDARVLRLFEEALLAAPPDERIIRLRLLVRAAGILPVRDTSHAHLHEANALARDLTDPHAAALAGAVTYQAGWRPDNLTERLNIATDLVQTARALKDRDLEFFALWMRVIDLLELGDRPQIDRSVAAIGEIAHASRQAMQLWITAVLQTNLATLDGRLEDAERLAYEAAALGRTHEPLNAGHWFALQIYVIRAHQGQPPDVDEFRRTISRPMRGLQTAAALILGLIDLDRQDEARALFERYAPGFPDIAENYLRLGALSLFGLACTELGDVRNAGVLYELLRPFTGHHAVLGLGIGSLGVVDRVLGMLAALLRRWDEAQTHFEVALAANDRLGARPWAAETRAAYATMLLGRGAGGDFDDAAHLLTHAATAGSELGMTSLLTWTRALKERVETARRIATTLQGGQEAARTPAPSGLTRREVEVLALLAAGHTNKKIAERLILSPLTVTRHITNIYAKIDARGRADATTFALRHGLIPFDRLDRADPSAPSSK